LAFNRSHQLRFPKYDGEQFDENEDGGVSEGDGGGGGGGGGRESRRKAATTDATFSPPPPPPPPPRQTRFHRSRDLCTILCNDEALGFSSTILTITIGRRKNDTFASTKVFRILNFHLKRIQFHLPICIRRPIKTFCLPRERRPIFMYFFFSLIK